MRDSTACPTPLLHNARLNHDATLNRHGRFGHLPFFRVTALLAIVALPLALSATTAFADTPTELLEKAIYTEETVGDLDAAIKVYQAVVSEANTSQQAAAMAQLRIGLCLQKQGKASEAVEAFNRVVEDYPAQTKIVAQAKKYLPKQASLEPVPWGNGDEFHLELKLANGTGVGTQIYRVSGNDQDGAENWVCQTWQIVTLNGQFNHSQVITDRQSFAPISSVWNHSVLGEATAQYSDGQVTINMSSRDRPTELAIDQPSYDNEQAAQVFRRLPLAVGYQTKLNIVATLGGAKVPLGLSVTEVLEVEVPAGKFECFRVVLDIGQTFWISTDASRTMVQFEAGGISAQLTKIVSPISKQPTKITKMRYTATLPVDWFAYTPSGQSKTGQKKANTSNTYLVDPVAAVKSQIEDGPKDVIAKEFKTPVAWLTNSMQRNQDNWTDFAMADDAIQEMDSSGGQAATTVFTYTEGNVAMTGRRVVIFGQESALNIRFMMATEDADALAPAIDAIIASVTVN